MPLYPQDTKAFFCFFTNSQATKINATSLCETAYPEVFSSVLP